VYLGAKRRYINTLPFLSFLLLEFGVNDGGGNGASCVGITLRTDTRKLSDMVITSFGDG